jgi:predicted ferric reductase
MTGAFLGAIFAALILPTWLPGIAQSISGPDPKAFWYLSRGSAFSSYLLLWASMMLGVGVTNKLSSFWPGLPPTIELHQFTSILGLFFGVFHALILLGDHFIQFSVVQILLPFGSIGFKPVLIGLGQLGFYLMLVITLSFYVRKAIGPKVWRSIHYLSFIGFVFVLIHGLTVGTDTTSVWAQGIYWVSGSALLFMILYRIIRSMTLSLERKRKLSEKTPSSQTPNAQI